VESALHGPGDQGRPGREEAHRIFSSAPAPDHRRIAHRLSHYAAPGHHRAHPHPAVRPHSGVVVIVHVHDRFHRRHGQLPREGAGRRRTVYRRKLPRDQIKKVAKHAPVGPDIFRIVCEEAPSADHPVPRLGVLLRSNKTKLTFLAPVDIRNDEMVDAFRRRQKEDKRANGT